MHSASAWMHLASARIHLASARMHAPSDACTPHLACMLLHSPALRHACSRTLLRHASGVNLSIPHTFLHIPQSLLRCVFSDFLPAGAHAATIRAFPSPF
eukprot:scaffold28933_cov22-Tisochrysis_lutea.AAC.3